jgi:hypothetical protein
VTAQHKMRSWGASCDPATRSKGDEDEAPSCARRAACRLRAAARSRLVGGPSGETKITDQTYVRHDGGTDATVASCNDDTPGTAAAGERQQNEPSAAVDPSNPDHMVAGANDYCNVPTGGDAWAGLYYSNSHGSSWINSLVPGYFQDTSAAGQASSATSR